MRIARRDARPSIIIIIIPKARQARALCLSVQVNDDDELTLIDFPQMVSTNHANAQELFDRDVECVLR